MWYKAVANVNVLQQVLLLPLALKSMELHRLAVDTFARAPEPFQDGESDLTVYHHLKQLAQDGVIVVVEPLSKLQEVQVEALTNSYVSACESLSKAESDEVLLMLLDRLPAELAQRLRDDLILD
jgi:hypothetical protein